MSKLTGVLELDVAAPRAFAACREVFGELAWQVLRDDGELIVAEEDATRLCCNSWPAKAELRVEQGQHGGASITIETRVPGRGPISSKHARESQIAIVRRIHARANGTGSPATG